jgi:serine/threonine protein kinase/tetratricopeptide (TPR) repeat protein
VAIDHPRYTVYETLGEGAQGRVVRVVDRERPELVLAAKVVRHEREGSRADVDAHLAGEFALLARLRIPGLVRVHDLGRDARGVLFLVEDLVDGADAITAVAKGADDKDRAQRLTSLTVDVIETLAALHDAGFVHGDVKPSNIRVPRATPSRAMLLDLGACVARSSVCAGSPGLAVHTPAFAAPEVKEGELPSVQADLFGLGATLWACATGSANRIGELRDRAPWVPPRLADVIASLIAPERTRRARTARDVLGALGGGAGLAWESGSREEHVREREVGRLLSLDAGTGDRRVLYLVGPSGAGKSHLVREVVTRALLAGRSARLVRFPESDAAFISRLVEQLRGGDVAGGDGPLLLVLDDLHAASLEVVEALESFRCMASTSPRARRVVVIATTRQVPAHAESLEIGPLDAATLERLCRAQGVASADAAREAGGLPGWLFASLGRVPLTAEAALARVASLPEAARDVLALVATLDGRAPTGALSTSEHEGLAACFEAGLLERSPDGIRLASLHLAADLAAALASYAISDRATAIALADPSLPAAMLAAAARAACPPERRGELLSDATERARREDARSIEIEMLLALLADPSERSPARLVRLERLTRDAGVARAHPQVLAWLAEAAATDPALGPLAQRRRAEERARAGDLPRARDAADRAIELAKELAHGAEEVYALATRGAIALWSASFPIAKEMFEAARALAATLAGEALDAEEIARLEHNVGVVALYRGQADEAASAFDRSIAIKRALGDRAGVRSCLLNLGLALTRLERWEEADAALVEATALADSLGQLAGRGWCLAARADLDVRRGRAREAERHVAEAEAIGDAVPKTIRVDLVLVRAQIALLQGDGRAALRALETVDSDLRREDALGARSAFARGRPPTAPAAPTEPAAPTAPAAPTVIAVVK